MLIISRLQEFYEDFRIFPHCGGVFPPCTFLRGVPCYGAKNNKETSFFEIMSSTQSL